MTTDMIYFKAFCARAANGVPVRALFICPTPPARDVLQLEMINEMDAQNIENMVLRSSREVRIGDSVAFLRVAYPYLDREMRGLELHYVHGLEHVRALPDGEDIAAGILSRVRQ